MPSEARPQQPADLHQAIWRWHFFAGLVVAPLLLVLATSGLVMLLRAPLETVLHGHLLRVPSAACAPGACTGAQAPGAQLAAVRAAFPHMQPVLFVPPRAPGWSSEFSLVPAHSGHAGHDHGHGAATLSVYVDPDRAQVLGSIDPARTPYGWANAVHGTLLLGDVGDAIIEIAAGLAVLLIVSGLYLARPGQRRAQSPAPPARAGRARTRHLHSTLGYWIAVPLLFFLLSGLTWTGVWGGRLVQAWNTVSLERSPPTMPAPPTHGDLSRAPLEEVPWALEQTPLPRSGSTGGSAGAGSAPDLDRIVAFAQDVGFTRFRIAFPRGDTGVWTVSASALARDTQRPADERFLHLDRHTGQVLADIRYADYSAVARFMAAGVPFHQGELGLWNVAFNATLCLAVIALVVLAAALWWQRRPGARLPAPPPRPLPHIGRRVAAGMFALALFFPMTAAAILVVISVDRLVIASRRRDEVRAA